MTESNTTTYDLYLNKQYTEFTPNINYNCYVFPKLLEIKSKNVILENDIDKIKNLEISVIINDQTIMKIPIDFFIYFHNVKQKENIISIPLNFEMFLSNIIFDFSHNQVKFGSDDKLWGQKFKIRVTSKKSGKAFDLNIKYIKNEIDLT